MLGNDSTGTVTEEGAGNDSPGTVAEEGVGKDSTGTMAEEGVGKDSTGTVAEEGAVKEQEDGSTTFTEAKTSIKARQQLVAPTDPTHATGCQSEPP